MSFMNIQFLKDSDSQKINIVNGIFLDRISHDGSLKELSNKFRELKSLVYEYRDRKEEDPRFSY